MNLKERYQIITGAKEIDYEEYIVWVEKQMERDCNYIQEADEKIEKLREIVIKTCPDFSDKNGRCYNVEIESDGYTCQQCLENGFCPVLDAKKS